MTPTPATASPVSSTPASGSASGVSSRAPKQSLNQQDFLKLLTIQLKNQDPLKPIDDNSFVTTMAQFTGLEQSSQILTSLKQMGQSNKVLAASGMIGREVTVRDSFGKETSGEVDAVETTDRGVMVKIADVLYSFDDIVRVAPVPETKRS